jgi:hypothetical protein
VIVIGDPVMLALIEHAAAGRSGRVDASAQGPEWFARQVARAGGSVAAGVAFDFERGLARIECAARTIEVARLESLRPRAGGDSAIAFAVGRLPALGELIRGAEFDPGELELAYAQPRARRKFLRQFYKPRHLAILRAKWEAAPGADEPVVFFHHIPKTGGMSVFHHCNEFLGWNEELIHLDGRADDEARRLGFTHYRLKDARELARVRVVFGHDVRLGDAARLGGRAIRWVTCLRPPAARLVSHYNWEMGQRDEAGRPVEAFEGWCARQRRNWMTRWLHEQLLGGDPAVSDEAAFDAVAAALDRFWLVCTTEDFEAGMRRLTESLGLPPIAKRTNAAGEAYPMRAALTGAIEERVARAHPLDVRLHERFAASGVAR